MLALVVTRTVRELKEIAGIEEPDEYLVIPRVQVETSAIPLNGSSQSNSSGSSSQFSQESVIRSYESLVPTHISDVSQDSFDTDTLTRYHRISNPDSPPQNWTFIGTNIDSSEFALFADKVMVHFRGLGSYPGEVVEFSTAEGVWKYNNEIITDFASPALLKWKKHFYVLPADKFIARDSLEMRAYAIFELPPESIVTGESRIRSTPIFVMKTSENHFASSIRRKEGWEDHFFRIVFPSGMVDRFTMTTHIEFSSFTISGFGQAQFLVSGAFSFTDFKRLIASNQSCLKFNLISILVEGTRTLSPEAPALKAAMNSRFLGRSYIFVPFLNYVMKLAMADCTEIFARLFHIFQSSGTGKTKLCLELLEHLKRGSYFVKRDSSSGFPLESEWCKVMGRRLINSRTDDAAIHIWIAFIFASVKAFDDLDPNTDRNVQTLFKADRFIDDETFSNQFQVALGLSVTDIRAKLAVELAGVDCFPLIIDEVQWLLAFPRQNSEKRMSCYEALLTAMAELKSLPIVAICLGTQSSLSDFAVNPTKSIRFRNQEHLQQVRPYSFTSSFDVALHQEPQILNYVELARDSLDGPFGNVYVPESLMRIARLSGRPCWSTKATLKSAMTEAMKMMEGDASIAKLSAFIMRTGSSINPQDTLAHRLVLSGLATLRYVDIEESDCEVHFGIEPVVSNVARLLVGSVGDLAVSLEQYLNRLNRGVVHELGPAGELVARIICLRVQDSLVEFDVIPDGEDDIFISQARINFPLLAVVKLRDFLKRLSNLGEDQLALMNLSEATLNGLVHLSQNFQLKRPLELNQVALAHAFVRGVCFILPEKFEGIDLLIPLMRSDNTFTCLVIQVKNLAQQSMLGAEAVRTREIVEKLHPRNFSVSLGRIGSFGNVPSHEIAKVVIQFRPGNSPPLPISRPVVRIVESRLGSNVLWLLGLDAFGHLFSDNHSIMDLLRDILSGPRDFVNAIPDILQPVLTPLQCTREGIRTQLSSFTVLESANYLLLTDSQMHSTRKFRTARNQLTALGVDLQDFPTTFEIAVSQEAADIGTDGDEGGNDDGENVAPAAQLPTVPAPSQPASRLRKRTLQPASEKSSAKKLHFIL